MSTGRLANWRRSLVALFPERHLYIRSGGEMRGYVLTTQKQLAAASVVAISALWLGVSTAAMVLNALAPSTAERRMMAMQARYERLIADREARLISYNSGQGSIEDRAEAVERQHAALRMLVNDLQGDGSDSAEVALAASGLGSGAPLARIEAVRADQERLITAAETYARNRAERLRYAFRLAGINPSTLSGGASGRGGPLIEESDPRALAAVLDVDESFAARIQRASANMTELRTMNEVVSRMPLARPTTGSQSSGYGVRFDPFTRNAAFHSGVDFSGQTMSPIFPAAPGTVSFTGVRQGYGNTIEIDHGGGFKTRYAHLRSISVRVGQRVGLRTRIGGMGSTGRSTGTHLHYEVWVNGRPQNPNRFLRAGEYVQQANQQPRQAADAGR